MDDTRMFQSKNPSYFIFIQQTDWLKNEIMQLLDKRFHDLEGKLVTDATRRLDTSVGGTVQGSSAHTDVRGRALEGAGEVNLLGQSLNFGLLLLQLLSQLLDALNGTSSWDSWEVSSPVVWLLDGTSGWSWSVAQDNGGQ